ncbi:MAG: hypothetical protein F4171_13110, partial [Gammaproteobacteria bacterium]|nr:hypothetical protein [Gammaproteobacteria bacterium]MYG13712.1 hypothetical protein [Gammaproteobacteria bacterium]
MRRRSLGRCAARRAAAPRRCWSANSHRPPARPTIVAEAAWNPSTTSRLLNRSAKREVSTHELQVAAVVPETEQAVRVRFAVPAGLKGRFDFEPGQYLTLTATIAGEELTRAYSICSLPGEPLEVGIKHLADGRFSGYANRSLAAGDR